MNNILLYLATIAIWGSSWLGIKYQLGVVAPELSVFYRFALAAVLLLGWCRLRGLSLRFTWRQHVGLAVQGTLLFSLNYIVFYVATKYLTSGLVAVTFSTILVMNMVFGALILGSPIRPRVALGAVLGMGGLSLVFWPDLAAFDTGSASLIGLGLSLIATAFASLGNVASVRNQRGGIPVVQGNAIGMAYGALSTLVIVLARGVPLTFDPSPLYVGALVYLAVFAIDPRLRVLPHPARPHRRRPRRLYERRVPGRGTGPVDGLRGLRMDDAGDRRRRPDRARQRHRPRAIVPSGAVDGQAAGLNGLPRAA